MKSIHLVCLPALLALALIAFVGCEVDSASENTLLLDPPYWTMRKGDTKEFTASGGFEYTWSLESEAWGGLAIRTGPKVTYINMYDPGSNATAVQVLRVTSRVATGTGTNASSYAQTAEAYITHIGEGEQTSTPATTTTTTSSSSTTSPGSTTTTVTSTTTTTFIFIPPPPS